MVGTRSKSLSKCPNLFQAATAEPDGACSLSLSLSDRHTHQHNFQLQHRDLPRDNSTSIHQERFYKVRAKTSEPMLTTSGLPAGPWPPV